MAVKRYDGSAWQTVAGLGAQGAAATSSSIATWVKTASGGETSLSGNDDSSQALSYTVGQELVFINGTLLKRGSDYTATNGTSITGLTALAANDVATVWTVNAFSVTNAISNNLVTTTGDIIYASAANTPARLGIGSTGQVLKVSGGIPSWGADSSGSLVFITSSSFSGSSAVNVNDCFSATYKNYLINIENTELASGSDIRLRARLRVSGADNTTSNYQESRQGRTWYASPGTFEGSTSNGDGWFFWGNFETTTGADATRGAMNTTVTLYQPFATAFTGYNLLSQTSDASQRAGGKFSATTSFTGFTIFPASSTITGTVKVYGIKDS